MTWSEIKHCWHTLNWIGSEQQVTSTLSVQFTALIHDKDIEQRRNAKSVKSLQNWLSVGSVSTLTSLHNHRLQELHPGTCEWLTPLLKIWLSSHEKPCFWIEGPPGCGKSFLLSFAANHVAQEISTEKSRAIFIFCKNCIPPLQVMMRFC